MLFIDIEPAAPEPCEPPKSGEETSEVQTEWPILGFDTLPHPEAARALRRAAWRAALLEHVRALGVLLLVLHLSACAVGTRRRVAAEDPPFNDSDAGFASADSGRASATPSSAHGDAAAPTPQPARDSGGLMDSGSSSAAAIDSGVARDAGADAATEIDAGPPEPPLVVPAGDHVVASADYVVTTGVNGLGISERFWVGWRFEVPAGETWQVDGVGFHNREGTGDVFGALVDLDGPDDLPDSVDLTSADVRDVQRAPLAGRGHVVAPVTATLTSGWYAIIFGTAAFGASSTGEYVGPSNGHLPISGAQSPFTILETTGATFSQRPGPRIFLFVRD